MLQLYPRNQIDFTWNGEPIKHTYDEHVVRDEGWYLKFKVLLDRENDYKKLKKGMVVKGWTMDGEQAFRIWDITKGHGFLEIEALHLIYDLDTKMTNPVHVNNGALNSALTQFKSGLPSEMGPFAFSTGISKQRTYNTEDVDRANDKYNAMDVFMDGAHSIVGTWEAELLINNWDIRLVESVGTRTGALLYEKKNIAEFEDVESNKSVITRIYAQSTFTPEREEGSDSEPQEVHLSVVVESPLINDYEQVHEAIYINNDARTNQELSQWAMRKFTYEKVDLPERTIKVSTNIIDGTEIKYGDYLVLKYLTHDVEEEIRCVGYDVNPVTKDIYEVNLGTNKLSMQGSIGGTVQGLTESQLNNEMAKVAERVTKVIMSSNGFNRIAYGPEPVPNPIEGDLWYEYQFDTPNTVTLKIWKDGMWVILLDDFMQERLKEKMEEVESQAEELTKEIEASDQKADEAKETAGLAKSASDAFGVIAQETAEKMVDVEQLIITAESNASEALSKATGAITQAGQAVASAQTAIDNAESAQSDAQTSLARAQSALDKSIEVESTTKSLVLEVDDLAGDISLKADSSVVNALKNTVEDHGVEISANSEAITKRVTTTTYQTGLATKENSVLKQSTAPSHLNGRLWLDTSVTPNVLKRSTGSAWVKATPTTASEVGAYSSGQGSALAGRVTSAETTITQTSEALTSKADKSVVDTLSGTVSTHNTTLTQHANSIASKAEQEEVDTVKGTVSTHTSTLEQQAKDISARLTQSQVDSLVSGKGYSTVSYVDNKMSVTAEGIRNEITAVEGKIPTEIGGRNYFTSALMNSIAEASGVLRSGDNWKGYSFSVNEGEQYTIHRTDTTNNRWRFYWVYTDEVEGSTTHAMVFSSDTQDSHVPNTVKVPTGAKWGYLYLSNNDSDGSTIPNIMIEKGDVATDWTPAPEDMMKQSDFNTFKAEYDQSAKGWSAKLLKIEQADYATKTWSNQTFATPQSVTTQLVSYAKTTDLNGMVTENTLATKNFITAGSVNTLLTNYAKTSNVPTVTQFNSLKNRYDLMEQTIGTTNDSVARAVMTSTLWETEVSKVIDSELKQQYKTITSQVANVTKSQEADFGMSASGYNYYNFELENDIPSGTKINVKFFLNISNNQGQQFKLDYISSTGSAENILSMNLTRRQNNVTTSFVASKNYSSNGAKLRLRMYDYSNYIIYFEMWHMKDHQVPIDGSNTGAISSKITQLYNMINLSILGKDGAMSRIAMGEEGIQIDGKLLHITSKTYIDDAVIKSAMIEALDAGKITTGELDASLVRVVNLDANSIAGNEANFIRALFDGTRSILEISGDRLSIVNHNGFASTSFESDGMTFYGSGERVATLKYRKYASGTTTSRSKFLDLKLEDDAQLNILKKSSATGLDEQFIVIDGGNGDIYTSATIRPSVNNHGIQLGGGTIGGTPVVFIRSTNGGGIAIGGQDFFYRVASGSWKRLS